MPKEHILMMQEQRVDGQKAYPMIDIIKFIGAFFVIIIHINPIFSYNSAPLYYLYMIIQHGIARVAVPFYFVASGFFLFRKVDLEHFDWSIIKTYILKILRLFAVWTILLFPGDTYPLWYMEGLVIAVIFLSILVSKRISLNKIIVLAAFLYTLGLLGDSYHGLLIYLKSNPILKSIITWYDTEYTTTRNGIFMGMPFVLIGLLFAKKRIRIRQSVAVVGLILSMGMVLVEMLTLRRFNLSKDHNMYLFLVPATVFLFSIGINVRLKPGRIYGRLRVAGTLIYYEHLFANRLVIWGLETLWALTGGPFPSSFVFFLMTVVVSASAAFAIEWLSHKERFAFLKWLYA